MVKVDITFSKKRQLSVLISVLFVLTITFFSRLFSQDIVVNAQTYSLFDGAVLYWDLNEGSGQAINDLSQHANSGTLGNTTASETIDPSRTTTGILGNALKFNDASSQKVTGLNQPSITNLAQNDFSVSYWQKWDNTSVGQTDTVMGKQGTGGWHIYVNPYRQIVFQVSCATKHGRVISADNSFPHQGYAHIAVVWNNSQGLAKIYVNGSEALLATKQPCIGGVTNENAINFELGRAAYSSNYFKGELDEVGIWNRALSATEAYQLYNNGAGLSFGSAPQVGEPPVIIQDQTKRPLMDMTATQNYFGLLGGLYENISNTVPSDHNAAGLAKLAEIQPLDTEGNASVSGKIALISIGMSNNSQEFCMGTSTNSGQACIPESFMGQAATNSAVNHTNLVIVNGAKGSQTAPSWDQSTDVNYDRIRDVELPYYGLTEKQVQVIWLKVVNAGVGGTASLPDPNASAYVLKNDLGKILRAIKVRYPNVKQVFVSSRTYGGYATNNLQPEPHAYETSYSFKWIIQAQIDQMRNNGQMVDVRAGDLNYLTGAAPWVSWGPYLWADGLNPRSDGLIWESDDFKTAQNDGVRLTAIGVQKVGNMLLNFFLGSTYTPWFKSDYAPSPSPTPTPTPSPSPTVTPTPTPSPSPSPTVTPTPTPAPTGIFSGTVSYLNFDENTGQNVGDSTGNNNSGVLGTNSSVASTDPSWNSGLLASGLLFNDSLSQMITGGKGALINNLARNDFSVSFWQNWDSTATGTTDTVLGKQGSGGWHIYLLNSTKNISLLVSCPTRNGLLRTANDSIPQNTWAYITIVWSSSTGTAKIYINGTEAAYSINQSCLGTPTDDSNFNFEIGRASWSVNYFKGMLDEVRIWNRALAPSEITSLYNSGAGLPFPQ